ncbi:hypothetical protein B0I35DRAFT_236976 [Stachybotrys elegans]|uniref:Uncharacterized protein n=1 Tax=Stachybotrys elegans TaxID=80388 RepID=A0A8K0WS70_9HYPO|nr:hypothetical protein B0I35DRAFT_236976 [Stachybotrys elegans]
MSANRFRPGGYGPTSRRVLRGPRTGSCRSNAWSGFMGKNSSAGLICSQDRAAGLMPLPVSSHVRLSPCASRRVLRGACRLVVMGNAWCLLVWLFILEDVADKDAFFHGPLIAVLGVCDEGCTSYAGQRDCDAPLGEMEWARLHATMLLHVAQRHIHVRWLMLALWSPRPAPGCLTASLFHMHVRASWYVHVSCLFLLFYFAFCLATTPSFPFLVYFLLPLVRVAW